MDAWVLQDGETVGDVMSAEFVEASRAQAAQRPDHTVPIAAGHWSTALMRDGTPAQLSVSIRRLVPCPVGWFEDPLVLLRFADLHIPANYIFLRQDLAAPRELFETMAASLGGPRIVECEGSRQAMITRPEAVAEAVLIGAKD